VLKAQGILETCVYAEDLNAAEAFYRDVLGLEFYAREPGRHVFFRCGRTMFLVFNPFATERADAHFPLHGAHGPGHAAFEVRDDEIESWKARLKNHAVPIETELEWPSGGRSIYFCDPAGNVLELATRRTWAWPDE
jgi:catechol 2,3-dioxygenase-like lactoylglutathione lyase family enzyme